MCEFILEGKGTVAFTIIMASTRRLLELMLWLLPWLQMVKSGYSIFKYKPYKNWDMPVVIPKDGVYLVSATADPCDGCSLSLQVQCRCEGKDVLIVEAFAKGIYSHAEVAVALRIYDRLYLQTGSAKVENASSFSVVYVGGLNTFYITVKGGFYSDRSPVTYTYQHTPKGWIEMKDAYKKTTFSVPSTGIYWVTGHIRPHRKSITMTVRSGSNDLFHVYGEKVKIVSTSGAFRLTAGSTIWAVTQGHLTYQPGTLLSVVYLVANEEANTYPFKHLAFTARTQENRLWWDEQVMDFKNVLTDYGYLYLEGYTEIRRTGSYMVSLRPDPDASAAPLEIPVLYVNGRPHWVIFAQQGVPIGTTISINLQAGSYLFVKSLTFSIYETGTMFSIAFIQP